VEKNLERFKGQYLKETEKKSKIKPKGIELNGYGSPGCLGYGCRKTFKKGGCL
jgi:hypothetical protein